MVRCFEDENVVHVEGRVNPIEDIETINLELIFADMETVDKKLEKANKMLKADKKYAPEVEALTKIKKQLEEGKPARTVDLIDEEKELTKDAFLLTGKPILYITNVSEEQLQNVLNDKYVSQVREYAQKEKAIAIPICAKIEEEISALDDSDKLEMLDALGLEETGLNKVITASYNLLGLMSFLTAGEPEVRAWTIKKGTKAPQAAGKIHSDIERGFIKAETISYDALMKAGSMVTAKESGLVRQEGKEYIMQDGDIVLFRFNV
jgi:GTP-binding protein YchF